MYISNDDCKKAIVAYVISNPNYIRSLIGDQLDKDSYCQIENWHNTSDHRITNKVTKRWFECYPYNGQLHAYTVDDGSKIDNLEIVTIKYITKITEIFSVDLNKAGTYYRVNKSYLGVINALHSLKSVINWLKSIW